MDETVVDDVTAPLRVRMNGRTVHLVAHAELRWIVARIVRVALFQIRNEDFLQIVQIEMLNLIMSAGPADNAPLLKLPAIISLPPVNVWNDRI